MSKLYLGSKELTAFNIGDKEVSQMYLGSVQVYDNTVIDYVILDQTITDPAAMLSGDINGEALRQIRKNSHRVVGKYTSEGTMTYCRLKDDDGTKYYDGTAASLMGTYQDVFMKLPRFFWKVTTESTDVFKIGLAYGGKPDDTWKEWDGNTLIGVYKGCINSSDKLYSATYRSPKLNSSQKNFKKYASNRGTGFCIVGWQMHCIMAMLYYCQYGHMDSQSTLGLGNSSSLATGKTDYLGMTDTIVEGNNVTGDINFWGLENWWGSYSEWMDNVQVDEGVWKITEFDGTERNVETGLNNSGFVTKMYVGTSFDMIPTELGATSTTSYCDNSKNSQLGYDVAMRSGHNYMSESGIVYVDTIWTANWYSYDVSSRLAFRGSLIEEKNVEKFKNISAIS